MNRDENIVAKGEVSLVFEQFLLLTQCLPKSSAANASENICMWERSNPYLTFKTYVVDTLKGYLTETFQQMENKIDYCGKSTWFTSPYLCLWFTIWYFSKQNITSFYDIGESLFSHVKILMAFIETLSSIKADIIPYQNRP